MASAGHRKQETDRALESESTVIRALESGN